MISAATCLNIPAMAKAVTMEPMQENTLLSFTKKTNIHCSGLEISGYRKLLTNPAKDGMPNVVTASAPGCSSKKIKPEKVLFL